MSAEKEALTLAIEALSWIETESMGIKSAFHRTAEQLKINNFGTLRFAYKLIEETVRRKNAIEAIATRVIPSNKLESLNLGAKNFVMVYICVSRFLRRQRLERALRYVQLAREILGWQQLHPVELYLGRLLTFNFDGLCESLGKSEQLALRTFHPPWFVDYCIRMMGEKDATLLLAKNAKAPPTYLRLNTLKGDVSRLLDKISKEGVVLAETNLPSLFRVIRSKIPLVKTKAYRGGLFQIQDKGSFCVVEASGVAKGAEILDVCAAPGIKTTALAEKTGGRGTIVSVDISERRLKILSRETKRLGFENINPILADAKVPLPIRQEFDYVFVDPPCSNTGVFWRDPLAKWALTEQKLKSLPSLQHAILENAAKHVRAGGCLIYSTCSILIEENEDIILRFLESHEDFGLEPIKNLEMVNPSPSRITGCVRFYPHLHESNGFFIAKLRRGGQRPSPAASNHARSSRSAQKSP